MLLSVADLGGGGGQGGALPPLKKMSTNFLLFVITINTVSLTFCPLIEKEIAQDLQDEDIINEFAANEKKTGILFCFKLITLVTSSIVIYVRTLGGT